MNAVEASRGVIQLLPWRPSPWALFKRTKGLDEAII